MINNTDIVLAVTTVDWPWSPSKSNTRSRLRTVVAAAPIVYTTLMKSSPLRAPVIQRFYTDLKTNKREKNK